MDQWLGFQGGLVGSGSLALLGVLTVAAVGTALLVGLGLAAFVRRRSQPYLLIASAFVALLGRSVVAAFAVAGTLSSRTHHLLEHGLDVVMVALVVAAVYYARTTVSAVDSNP